MPYVYTAHYIFIYVVFFRWVRLTHIFRRDNACVDVADKYIYPRLRHMHASLTC